MFKSGDILIGTALGCKGWILVLGKQGSAPDNSFSYIVLRVGSMAPAEAGTAASWTIQPDAVGNWQAIGNIVDMINNAEGRT